MSAPALGTGADTAAVALRLAGHADAFLTHRGLTRAGIADRVVAATGAARHLLLTSSPVQGLANDTSDIDVVRVQDEAMSGARMPAQLFDDGQHLEVITYAAAEVDAALADLRRAADGTVAERVAAHTGWDRAHELRRKYLERIVHGVDLAGGSPYVDHLPALARLWTAAGAHTATRHALLCGLAEAAGESRGRAGYALQAWWHLMDTVLSAHGDVYSNRKWFTTRWARARDAGALDPVIGEHVDALREPVEAALAGRGPADLAARVLAALEQVTVSTGDDRPPALRTRATDPGSPRAFLPGARIALGRGLAVRTGSAGPPADVLPLHAAPTDPTDAADLLRALRAGALLLEAV